MKNEYKKDYPKLRPFDEASAKNGEEICWFDSKEGEILEYIAGPDIMDRICYSHEGRYFFTATGNLRMKPLAWVEGLPVYKEDVLYWNDACGKDDVGSTFIAKRYHSEMGIYGNSYCNDGTEATADQDSWVKTKHLTWNKPKQKVKRKIWVNVYSDKEFSAYDSEKLANYNSANDRIACVETEIEYEV